MSDTIGDTNTITSTTSSTKKSYMNNSNNNNQKYEDLRKNNYDKIFAYYTKINDQYNRKLEIFNRDRYSEDNEKKDYANNIIKNQLSNYEIQILKINQEMLALLTKNDEIIIQQKHDVETLKQEIDDTINKSQYLKQKQNSLKEYASGYESNYNKLNDELDNSKYQFRTYRIFIIITVILDLLLAIYAMWLANTSNDFNSINNNYNNYNNSNNFNMTKNNNMKNI